jgi:anti-sigma B factor antagonist
MRTHSSGEVLSVTDFTNLGATNAGLFRDFVRATLKPEHRFIEVDLQQANFIDSEGLGALISAHKAVASRGGCVRLIGANTMVTELFRLTRLDQLFEFLPGT